MVVKLLALLLLFSVLFLGCSKSPHFQHTALRADPNVLDFGNVRELDSPVNLKFDIVNDTSHAIAIATISSGCGCTVIDIPQKPIPPQGRVPISLKIDLTGKKGDFWNIVRVQPDGYSDVLVNLNGRIVSDIWYDGQTLYCSAEPDQQEVSTTLTLHTVDCPNVAFDLSKQEDGIAVTELSRENLNGETFIHFSVKLDIRDSSSIYRIISFIPMDSDVSPIRVPISCDRDVDSPTSGLHTTQVNLGDVKLYDSITFSLYGTPDVLSLINSASFEEVAGNISTTIQIKGLPKNEKDEFYLDFSFVVNSTKISGFFEGMLCLTTTDGQVLKVPLRGGVKSE